MKFCVVFFFLIFLITSLIITFLRLILQHFRGEFEAASLGAIHFRTMTHQANVGLMANLWP